MCLVLAMDEYLMPNENKNLYIKIYTNLKNKKSIFKNTKVTKNQNEIKIELKMKAKKYTWQYNYINNIKIDQRQL